MFGPEFAPPENAIRAGWQEAVGATSIPPAVADAAFGEFRDAFIAGEPGRQLQARLRGHLKPLDWRWPWFEEWRARFAARGKWPYLWLDIIDAQHRGGACNMDLTPLLEQTIASTIFRLRDLDQWAGMIEPLFPILSPVNDAMGEIETEIAKEMWPRIAGGDWSILPPFFPGDRTLLRADFSPFFERWLERSAPEWIRVHPPRPVTISR